jgi:hypothetical protein
MRKLNLYLSIVVINLLLYLVLTFGLVNYEDAFDGSKGEFYSLSSMEITEIICFLSLILWYVINSILLCLVLFKLWRKKKHTPIAIKSSNEVKFIGMWVLKMLSKLIVLLWVNKKLKGNNSWAYLTKSASLAQLNSKYMSIYKLYAIDNHIN